MKKTCLKNNVKRYDVSFGTMYWSLNVATSFPYDAANLESDPTNVTAYVIGKNERMAYAVIDTSLLFPCARRKKIHRNEVL